jgi:hypothetical protein
VIRQMLHRRAMRVGTNGFDAREAPLWNDLHPRFDVKRVRREEASYSKRRKSVVSRGIGRDISHEQ